MEFVPLIVPTRIFGEKIDIEVSKKGGKYSLVNGCILSIEEGIFIKKAAISICTVPPNKRCDFAITCEYQSYLASELFIICSKFAPKRPITIYIPCVIPPNRFCQLISSTKIDFNWTTYSDYKLEPGGMSFTTDTWGLYAVIQKSPNEKIRVTKQGGLLNTVIHPLVSIRIPKMACPLDRECTMQYLEANKETVEEITPCYPTELTNIVNFSAMLCFTFPNIQFKRPVTIKVPLPKWALETENEGGDIKKTSELMLLCKRQGSWDTVETMVNYTKNTFSFDTKIFGTFVLLEPKANREGKVKMSLPRLEYANNVVRGAFLIFIFFEAKSWFLWVELAPSSKILQIKTSREAAGLIFIEQFTASSTNAMLNSPLNKSGKKTASNSIIECRRTVELSEGSVYHLRIEGDVKFKESSKNQPIVSKQFQKMFHSIIKKGQRTSVLSVQRHSTEESEDSDEDFLSKVGGKKDSAIKSMDSVEVAVSLSMIFYTKLAENYRIIEIEPKDSPNLATVLIEKWKQRTILVEDRGDIIEEKLKERLKRKVENEIPEIPLDNKSDDSNENVSSDSSIELEGSLLRAQTKESMARTYFPDADEDDFTFSAVVKIVQERKSLQIPPNQFECEISDEKRKEALGLIVPKDVSYFDYQYKFNIEPEEMREYLNIPKPNATAVLAARDNNAEKLMNPYLKEINRSDIDPTLLQKTKLTAVSNIMSKTNQVLYNDPTPTKKLSIKDGKSKGSKHKESNYRSKKILTDYISPSSRYKHLQKKIFKEPKVLSGKSLQVLSRHIEQGLTLAVHLNIPDSAITGIGFDCLSSKLTLAEVNYKVFTHWKRSTDASERKNMVALLIQSLRNMNLNPIADIVTTADEKNEELVKESFKFIALVEHKSSDQDVELIDNEVEDEINTSIEEEVVSEENK